VKFHPDKRVTKIVLMEGDIGDLAALSESKIEGVGLFAKENIAKGITIHTTHFHHEEHGWVNVIPNCKYNHSKPRANCNIVTLEVSPMNPVSKELVSLCSINKGEELLVDYTQDNDLEQPQDSWVE